MEVRGYHEHSGLLEIFTHNPHTASHYQLNGLAPSPLERVRERENYQMPSGVHAPITIRVADPDSLVDNPAP